MSISFLRQFGNQFPVIFSLDSTCDSPRSDSFRMEMTVKKLKELCRKDSLYSTPYLNDKLYLHYKGFRQIENLEEYTGLKVLWLEGNGLGAIQGLDKQAQMRTLYLQENLIERIENLSHMTELVTLNLNKNLLSNLNGLETLSPTLQTLMVGNNHFGSSEGCEALRTCKNVSTLDIQENRIEDPEILNILADMPQLAVLYLQGNPCVKKIRHYRKHVIGKLKNLKYLDDRPVFDDERKRCDVWYSAWTENAPEGAEKNGGAGFNDAAAMAAERAEMERQRLEKIETEERNFNAFADFVRRSAEDRAKETSNLTSVSTVEGTDVYEEEEEEDAESNLPKLPPGTENDEDDVDDEVDDTNDALSAAIRAFDPENVARVKASRPAAPPVKPISAVAKTTTSTTRRPVAPPALPSSSSSNNPAVASVYNSASDPSVSINPFSGEPIVPNVESEEAKAYRLERWERIVKASDYFRGNDAALRASTAAAAASSATTTSSPSQNANLPLLPQSPPPSAMHGPRPPIEMPSPPPAPLLFVPDAPEIPADSLLFEQSTSPPPSTTSSTTTTNELVSEVVKEVAAEDAGLAERLETARIKAQAFMSNSSQTQPISNSSLASSSVAVAEAGLLLPSPSTNVVVEEVTSAEEEEVVEPVLVEHTWTVVEGSTPAATLPKVLPESEQNPKIVSPEKTSSQIDNDLEDVD